ncbi:MAG: helix-turn-helix transcriptional regulator [Bacteroidales bacterium]|nr:helix-turn-helix transcriptional regulator [Bacteroidales bacterium]
MIENELDIALTSKEKEIILLIAEGLKTPVIAARLGLAGETVKWYRKRILDKFQAATSAEVVRKAIELKLI